MPYGTVERSMADFSPALNFTSNTAAPLYLAYTARKAEVKRFIYACSCSIYGHRIDGLTDESSIPSAEYPYGISGLTVSMQCLVLSLKSSQ